MYKEINMELDFAAEFGKLWGNDPYKMIFGLI